MPKLKSFSAKEIIKILKQNGFQLDHSTGSHFIFYHRESKTRVVVPYHNKSLPKGTMYSILKQAEIDKDDLTG